MRVVVFGDNLWPKTTTIVCGVDRALVTIDVCESGVNIGRHSTEHVADVLWVISVNGHSTSRSVLP